jgi:hypothetical protein
MGWWVHARLRSQVTVAMLVGRGRLMVLNEREPSCLTTGNILLQTGTGSQTARPYRCLTPTSPVRFDTRYDLDVSAARGRLEYWRLATTLHLPLVRADTSDPPCRICVAPVSPNVAALAVPATHRQPRIINHKWRPRCDSWYDSPGPSRRETTSPDPGDLATRPVP